jgi:hypothetical protein
MTGCPAKPQEQALQPRSQAGLGAGSHSTCQRVVGPAIRDVQPAYERMDFVQGWQIDACLAAGRGMHACVLAASGRQGVASCVRKSIPLPPAPSVLRMGAHPEIFPTFSREVNPSLFFHV